MNGIDGSNTEESKDSVQLDDITEAR